MTHLIKPTIDPPEFKLKTANEIKNWLSLFKINKVKSFEINSDLSVTVNGSFLIYEVNLKELPFQLDKVCGNMNISDNELITLKGMPQEIQGNLHMHNNCLKNLDYLPKKVDGYIMLDICNKKEFLKLINIDSFVSVRMYLPVNTKRPKYMSECGKIETIEYFTQDSFDTHLIRHSFIIEFDEYKAYVEKEKLNKSIKSVMSNNLSHKNKL